MNKENYTEEILALATFNKCIMLELPTGFGKSYLSMQIIGHTYNLTLFKPKVLIVVPKNVLKKNWDEEVVKWNYKGALDITYTTYVSFPKYCGEAYRWDYVIFDETHHFTDRCLEASYEMNAGKVICMSATIPYEQKERLKEAFPGIKRYKVETRTAIDEGILPDPNILLIPMLLNNTERTETFVKNPKIKRSIEFDYPEFRKHRFLKNIKMTVHCTEQEYYNYLSEMADWWKTQYINSSQQYQKNQWLQKCNQRLHYLADRKDAFIQKILGYLDEERVLTLCSSVAQTERLGKFCINSKNGKAQEYLDKFNNREINHITSCNIVNEGCNLVDCQIGIFGYIDASEIARTQRIGRLLRHKNPLLIIPYYIGTREEELVEKKMKPLYNAELIKTIHRNELTKELLKELL